MANDKGPFLTVLFVVAAYKAGRSDDVFPLCFCFYKAQRASGSQGATQDG